MGKGYKGYGGKLTEVQFSQLARANKTAMTCHLIENVVITLAYTLELVKGAKTMSVFLICALTALLPVAMEIMFYKKSPVHPMIKHLVSFGFALFYITALFTSDNSLTFMFVIPMLVAITIYSDVKYSLEISVCVVIVNIIHIALLFKNGQQVAEGMPHYEIRLLVLVVIAAFSYYTAKVSQQLNQEQIQAAETEKEHSKELLQKVLDVSGNMKEVIHVIASDIKSLGESIQNTQLAMGELSNGATDTADAVQKQLSETEAIADKVEAVKKASDQIAENMENTQAAIGVGHGNIEELMNQVAQSEKTNVDVANELSDLKGYMEQMFSIIEIINHITSETSLLSLNASIEAARAGEAGRGFAVVASEISGLANQTQDATVNIEKLIKNVSREIEVVVDTVENMIKQSEQQNHTVAETAHSFEKISGNAQGINEQSNNLAQIVGELKNANASIMDSIQTISAITEEVAAHTNQTYETCEENTKVVGEVNRRTMELEQLAGKLNN